DKNADISNQLRAKWEKESCELKERDDELAFLSDQVSQLNAEKVRAPHIDIYILITVIQTRVFYSKLVELAKFCVRVFRCSSRRLYERVRAKHGSCCSRSLCCVTPWQTTGNSWKTMRRKWSTTRTA